MSAPRRARLRDLGVAFHPEGGFLVRAPGAGIAARVPVHALELLAFCSEPRARAEAEARFGPAGGHLWDGLAEAGLLADPAVAAGTSVMFENFAALDVHRRMLADRARMAAYADAIAACVRPGMAVLDAGTGSGVLAALAALAGARVVYAVDRSDMIDAAAELFRTMGIADRAHALRADLATVTLPEPVDLVVTETFGALALAEGGLPDVAACCARNLAPGGTVLPSGLSLHLAPAADPALLDEAVGPFADFRGVALGVLRPTALGRALTTTVRSDQLLRPGAPFAHLPLPAQGRASGGAVLEGSDGEAVGFAAWFSLHLAPGIDLGTGPRDPPTHWRQQLLPADRFPVRGPLAVEARVEPAPDDRRGARIEVAWSSDAGAGRRAWRLR